jgi:hypothetical protein
MNPCVDVDLVILHLTADNICLSDMDSIALRNTKMLYISGLTSVTEKNTPHGYSNHQEPDS